MSTFISVLIILVCILLIAVVLIQNSKGGGISSSFGAPNQMMGVKKTAETVEKITWGLAASLLLLSIVSASFNGPSQSQPGSVESVTRQKATESAPVQAPINNSMPSMPMQQAPETNE